jgi:hypothetical protein
MVGVCDGYTQCRGLALSLSAEGTSVLSVVLFDANDTQIRLEMFVVVRVEIDGKARGRWL